MTLKPIKSTFSTSSISNSSILLNPIDNIKILKEEEQQQYNKINTTKLIQTRSLKEQIVDDYNQTIQEENFDLISRKDISPEDALSLHLHNTHESDTEREEDETNFPDGGYGWVACFAVFLVMFNTWGANASFGVFLSFYLGNDTFPGATSIEFAYLAGMTVGFAQLFSPIALIVTSIFGLKVTMSVACFTHFAGYILASFATKLWQLFICQGVVVGISYSFMVIPACSIIPSWFLKKRGIASGILFAGTGMGGLTYSLSINALIQTTGDQRWSLRMCAILSTGLISLAIILIRFPNPISKEPFTMEILQKSIKVILFNKKVWFAPQFYSITFWFILQLFGYNLILFSYATAARSLGLSQHQASILTAMMNVGQVVGRPMMGFLADKYFGRVNYSIFLTMVIIVLLFGFWMNATSYGALLVCGLFLGYTFGVASVMNTTFIADAFDKKEFAGAWSLLNMSVAPLVLFVEVIALKLKDEKSTGNPFRHTQIFCGCLYVCSLIALAFTREWHVRKTLRIRRERSISELGSKNPFLSKDILPQNQNILVQRIANYDELLENSPICWFKRMVYPLKI